MKALSVFFWGGGWLAVFLAVLTTGSHGLIYYSFQTSTSPVRGCPGWPYKIVRLLVPAATMEIQSYNTVPSCEKRASLYYYYFLSFTTKCFLSLCPPTAACNRQAEHLSSLPPPLSCHKVAFLTHSLKMLLLLLLLMQTS